MKKNYIKAVTLFLVDTNKQFVWHLYIYAHMHAENKKQEDILEKFARDPSLSTILEERSSQMVSVYETAEGLDEISVSIDGKEVSVSLYETPDLTEQDAKNIIEMFADEYSEYISGSFSIFHCIVIDGFSQTTHFFH